jgi:hypothetical protein
MPERIYFHTKKLADAVTQKIEHTYFLDIEELIADVHGNKYHPMDEDVGSMCATAGFPHAIAFQKEKGRGKAKPTLEYVVAASNTVELNVRLKKRERAGKGKSTEVKTVDASEAELIELIGSQRTVGQMQDDLNYEKDMSLPTATTRLRACRPRALCRSHCSARCSRRPSRLPTRAASTSFP